MVSHQPTGQPLQQQMPAFLLLGDTDAGDNDRTTSPPGSQSSRQIGVKQERLENLRAILPQSGPQTTDDAGVEGRTGIEAMQGYARRVEIIGQRATAAQTVDDGLPPVTIQSPNQTDQRPLGSPRIKLGNAESDRDGLGHCGSVSFSPETDRSSAHGSRQRPGPQVPALPIRGEPLG